MYEYNATVQKIVDGDTIDVMIDLGFDVFRVERVRLARINCPELKTAEGVLARAHVYDIVNGKSVVIKTSKNKFDRYGRWLAEVYVGDLNLSDDLLQKNLAVPYP